MDANAYLCCFRLDKHGVVDPVDGKVHHYNYSLWYIVGIA